MPVDNSKIGKDEVVLVLKRTGTGAIDFKALGYDGTYAEEDDAMVKDVNVMYDIAVGMIGYASLPGKATELCKAGRKIMQAAADLEYEKAGV
jgi:hypothetical protein